MADRVKFKKTRDKYAISGLQISGGITYVILIAILIMLVFVFSAMFVHIS